MDAPPAQNDCAPFLHTASLIRAAGLNGPEVLARDEARGFLLLSDLGPQTYLHAINEHNADALMGDAITALIQWQRSSQEGVLPPYDAALLERELQLFPDWYVARHLGKALTAPQQADWDAVRALLIQSALAQPRVFVHRDYMPRNLMISTPNPGVLDFQDAVYGPITYDVVSLFKDAFLSWPAERVAGWRDQYWTRAKQAGLPVNPDHAAFVREFNLMGAQRHLKVLGIFARINYRDGKPHYLTDTPRFIRYLRELLPVQPELAPLGRLFDSLGLHA
jgi:hypothetical protein